MKTKELWRAIPGYDGAYEVNQFGEIRSWKQRGFKKDGVPYKMKPSLIHHHHSGSEWVIYLKKDGKQKRMQVRSIMRDVWMDGKIPGKIVIPKDGDTTNCALSNLRYESWSAYHCKKPKNRKTVKKVDAVTGEVLAYYKSIVEAAKKNHYEYSTVWKRIAGRTVVDGIKFEVEV